MIKNSSTIRSYCIFGKNPAQRFPENGNLLEARELAIKSFKETIVADSTLRLELEGIHSLGCTNHILLGGSIECTKEALRTELYLYGMDKGQQLVESIIDIIPSIKLDLLFSPIKALDFHYGVESILTSEKVELNIHAKFRGDDLAKTRQDAHEYAGSLINGETGITGIESLDCPFEVNSKLYFCYDPDKDDPFDKHYLLGYSTESAMDTARIEAEVFKELNPEITKDELEDATVDLRSCYDE